MKAAPVQSEVTTAAECRSTSAPRPATESLEPPQLPPGNTLLLALQALLTIIIVAVFIITFTVQPFRIPSSSMIPTLLVGDFLLVDKQTAVDRVPLPSGRIKRGDIIVFHYPPNPSLHLVKRVVGLPGERVRMHNDQVFINGTPLTEPYALYRSSPPDAFRDDFPELSSTSPDVDAHWWMELRRLEDRGELRIPAGEYFVLGDNRNNSEDSRYWGLVSAGDVIGKPLLVYLSLREPDADASPDGDRSSQTTSLRANLRSLARWQRAFHVIR